ncbi:hypothetical protein HD806DRAFT_519033 [Xylariaceae sp. AK1471]|nr:hypothetical protein HD806DRAFT_519033 [Xylariaceae sp. AK1471]
MALLRDLDKFEECEFDIVGISLYSCVRLDNIRVVVNVVLWVFVVMVIISRKITLVASEMVTGIETRGMSLPVRHPVVDLAKIPSKQPVRYCIPSTVKRRIVFDECKLLEYPYSIPPFPMANVDKAIQYLALLQSSRVTSLKRIMQCLKKAAIHTAVLAY